MRDEIDRFTAALANERNASPHTLRAYSKDLSQLESFAQARLGHDPSAAEIDLWLLRAFFADLHARKASPTTAGRKLATFRSFFRFLCREGTLTKNPARSLLGPRKDLRIPTYLQEQEAGDLMNASDKTNISTERDMAILELLYSTGMRCSEVVGLAVDDVDQSNRSIRILGKGRKERWVPFGSPASIALSAYLATRPRVSGQDPLFTGTRGKALSDQGEHAHPPPLLRHSPAAARRGSSLHPGAPGPLQPLDDPAIHPREPEVFARYIQADTPKSLRLVPLSSRLSHRSQEYSG